MELLLLIKGRGKRGWKFEIDIKKYRLAIRTSGTDSKKHEQKEMTFNSKHLFAVKYVY